MTARVRPLNGMSFSRLMMKLGYTVTVHGLQFGKGATSEKANDDARQCQPGDNKWWGGWQFTAPHLRTGRPQIG